MLKSSIGLCLIISSKPTKIRGVIVSSREKAEYELVRKQILECDPSIFVAHFDTFLHSPDILRDKIDLILTIGGDGSVAWLVGAYYKAFDSIDGIKPIVPVVRPESVGYLKQLELEGENFKEGFKKLIQGEYEVVKRTVLHISVDDLSMIAVNEVLLSSNPHLGKFTISIANGQGIEEVIAEIYADGAMIATSIGSTAWSLSHGGLLNLHEDSLQLIFIGAMHRGANYIIPKKGTIYINLDLKNPVITKETIFAYNQAREKRKLPRDDNARHTLSVVYGSQVLVDGKVLTFGSKTIKIDSSWSIPFVTIKDHTIYEKARRYTKNTEAIW